MKANIVCSMGLGAAVLLAAGTARAGTYEVDYTGVKNPLINGDVIITTADTPAGGPFAVTSISGERGGDAVTALSSYAGSDQLLSASNPHFDFSGVSFTTANSDNFNLFSNNGNYYELSSNVDPVGYPQNGSQISLTVSVRPRSC